MQVPSLNKECITKMYIPLIIFVVIIIAFCVGIVYVRRKL